jgi:hypothetical protein
MLDYEYTEVIDNLRNGGETPPTWLRTGVYLSLIGAVYMWGVMHGIQIGAAAQAMGSIMVPPVFVELPFTVGGGSRFIPSATMFEVADRAQYTAMAFAGLALSAIIAWTLHTRLP